MEILHERCAGLDVHKTTVMATVRWLKGRRVHTQTQQFGTMTREILGMADWLSSFGVRHVAMESTGVLWKPIYNLLEGRFELLLCNAKHIKQVPGRKTDVKDSEWIAQLLQCGLLKGSFVPSRHLRDLRDLTRHRAQLSDEKTRVVNRVHKILEDANIKLSSVASDILGVSGRAMLDAMSKGEKDPMVLAEFAKRRLRKKLPALREALCGRVSDHHRFMLDTLLKHVVFLENEIDELETRIEQQVASQDAAEKGDPDAPMPFAEAVALLAQIPGIDIRTAHNLLAEIGRDMSRFPSAKHLASWAGVCPGNNESAGKRKKQKTTKGNRWLRRGITQAAWAASRTKNTYYAAMYRRLVSRLGKKRTIVAIGHALLQVVYHVLDRRGDYQDLGSDYFDRIKPARRAKYHVRRLRDLGYEVTVTPAA